MAHCCYGKLHLTQLIKLDGIGKQWQQHVGWVERGAIKNRIEKMTFKFTKKPKITKTPVKPNTFLHLQHLDCWVSLCLPTELVH